MLSIPVNHPDVEEFINIKTDLKKITNANISIRVDDKFMRAVQNNEAYILSYTRNETGEKIEKWVDAREIFHKICKANWNYAEPGILFWDRITKHNMLVNDPNFTYEGVNPCAEEPLPGGGSCLLGALNLAEFVKSEFTDDAIFDFEEFKEAIIIAVQALNEVLDEGLVMHPLKEQQECVNDWRQIGLGIFGLADMLIKLGLRYGSDEAADLCNEIAQFMFTTALDTSDYLGGIIGAYPKYNKDIVNSSELVQSTGIQTEHLANSQLLTIAPTGTLSTMLGISGGIEPIFANSYTRRTVSLHGEDVVYKVYTPIVKEYMERFGVTEDNLPDYFVVASDIDPSDRILMQASWQDYIDASISSTINLPNSATVEDVERIYMEAFEQGLKGITIYRAGCAREGILIEDKEETKPAEISHINPDTKTIGFERHLTTGCGSLHVCAFFDANGKLVNTYLAKGSTGGCNNYMIGLSRMIGLAARSGASVAAIIDQLDSCGACPSYAVRKATKHDVSPGSCCPVAVGKALAEMYEEVTGMKVVPVKKENNGINCPKCEAPLIQEGGCVICKNCGWSKCD